MIGLWVVIVSVGIVLGIGLTMFIHMIVYDFKTKDYQAGVESILFLLLLLGIITGSTLMLMGI